MNKLKIKNSITNHPNLELNAKTPNKILVIRGLHAGDWLEVGQNRIRWTVNIMNCVIPFEFKVKEQPYEPSNPYKALRLEDVVRCYEQTKN